MCSTSRSSLRILSMSLTTRSALPPSLNSAVGFVLDHAERSAGVVLGVLHDFPDAHLAFAQALAELDDLLDGDRRGRSTARMTAFSPSSMRLAISTSPFAGEQRDRAHLAQVHAHRVVALGVAGVEVLVPLFFLLLLGRRSGSGRLGLGELDLGGVVDDLDVVLAEHRHHVVDLIGGHDVGGQRVVDLVVGQEALLAAAIEQRLHLDAVGGGAPLDFGSLRGVGDHHLGVDVGLDVDREIDVTRLGLEGDLLEIRIAFFARRPFGAFGLFAAGPCGGLPLELALWARQSLPGSEGLAGLGWCRGVGLLFSGGLLFGLGAGHRLLLLKTVGLLLQGYELAGFSALNPPPASDRVARQPGPSFAGLGSGAHRAAAEV